MSVTSSSHPLMAAMVKAEQVLGSLGWEASQGIQEIFVHEFYPTYRAFTSIPQISSVASADNEVLKKFLADNGMAIDVPPFAPGDFGIAALLDAMVRWEQPGDREKLSVDGVSYDAVFLDKMQVRCYRLKDHPYPVFELRTSQEDLKVFITPTNEHFGVGDDPGVPELVTASIMELTQGQLPWRVNRDYWGVVFPMVNITQMQNVSFIEGVKIITPQWTPYQITQATQKNRLRINEIGARAQSAVITHLQVMGASPAPYRITQPFLFWIIQEGCELPLFSAYITKEDWKDPGSLEDQKENVHE